MGEQCSNIASSDSKNLATSALGTNIGSGLNMLAVKEALEIASEWEAMTGDMGACQQSSRNINKYLSPHEYSS